MRFFFFISLVYGCMWFMRACFILFVAKALPYIADIERLFILGVGPLLVQIVLVAFSFGTVSMGRFCRHILFTKVMRMLWQRLPAITGCFLLVPMVRYTTGCWSNLKMSTINFLVYSSAINLTCGISTYFLNHHLLFEGISE